MSSGKPVSFVGSVVLFHLFIWIEDHPLPWRGGRKLQIAILALFCYVTLKPEIIVKWGRGSLHKLGQPFCGQQGPEKLDEPDGLSTAGVASHCSGGGSHRTTERGSMLPARLGHRGSHENQYHQLHPLCGSRHSILEVA